MVIAVVASVVLALCGVGAAVAIRSYLADPGRAKVGDCLAPDADRPVPYRKVGCDDPGAGFTVLTAAEADGNPCVDVPGASRLYTIERRTFCVGRKGADPARAANVAKDGDCLRIGRDIEAERRPCADPEANVEVLRRLTDVPVERSSRPPLPGLPGKPGPCAEVERTELAYTYEWRSDPPRKPVVPSFSVTTVDLMFCLARVNLPPAVASDQGQDCRYVTVDALLAAVVATSGMQYTEISGHLAGPFGCTFELTLSASVPRDRIDLQLSAEPKWPPADGQEFDLDGVKAAWHLGVGGEVGTLSVARPIGRFEITLVSLGALNQPRETAVAIWRLAAPHVP
jgi:hypothetical protein